MAINKTIATNASAIGKIKIPNNETQYRLKADTIDNFHVADSDFPYQGKATFSWNMADLACYGPPDYAATTSYYANNYVCYNGGVYKSLSSGNKGNTPSSSPTKWEDVTNSHSFKVLAYNSSKTYSIDDRVRVGTNFYVSLVNDNINHAPASSATYWRKVSLDIYILIDTGQNYYSNYVKFQVQGAYDNVSGTTQLKQYCRNQNYWVIDTVGYNGQKQTGVYQVSANTNHFWFRFSAPTATYAPSQFGGSATIFCNIPISSVRLVDYDNDNADFATVANYNYVTIANDFRYTNLKPNFVSGLQTSGTVTLGGTVNSNGTVTFSGAVLSNNSLQLTGKLLDKSGSVGSSGQILSSTGSQIQWVNAPSFTDTWRAIKVDGTEKLGTATSTGAVNFAGGTNISLNYASGTITINNDYTYIHPTYNTQTAGLFKIGRDATGHVVIGDAFTIPTKDSWNYDDRYKLIQTAVSDPTSSGNATSFIDSISQNTQGVITVTKKAVDFSGYATTTDLNDYVTLATNQTITGTKLFTSRPLSVEAAADLPAGYTQVQYIENEGDLYIDTGLVPTTTNVLIELDMQWTGDEISKFETFAGFMSTSSGNVPRLGISKYTSQIMFGLNSTSYGGAVNESRHKIQVRTTDGYHQLSVDNQVTGSHPVSSDALTGNTMPIYLWARNNNGALVNYATMRLFRARIVIDNVSYEFIPCKNSSNVVGLYDIEHDQFYTKTGGTGAFVAGPENLDTDEFLIRSDLNEIAFSGSYNDLSNKPNISNATITIKQTGISDQTFTLNGSTKTITLADTNTTYTFATGDTNGTFKVTPSGGSAQSVLIKGLQDPAFSSFTTSITSSSTNTEVPTAKAVWDLVDGLPEAMVFKGTLGTGGTITSLPTAAAANEGFVYKVITAGTYASKAAKVGDTFVCAKTGTSTYEWILIPSGDDIEDTWRAIKVNDTELLGNGISTGALNLKNGGNITVTGSGNDITLGVASGYSIPLTSKQDDWDAKQPAGNYVTTDTVQTITANKTFGNSSTAVEAKIRNGAFVLGGVEGSVSNTTSKISFQNNSGTEYHYIKANTSGVIFSAASNNYGFYSYGFTPTASNELDLGRSNVGSGRWRNIHMCGYLIKYDGDTAYTLTIRNKTGTIALLSDIPKVNYPVTDVQINSTSIVTSKIANFLTKTAYNASTNKIVTESDLPTVSNATITIKQTGHDDQTFTLNGSAQTITLSDTITTDTNYYHTRLFDSGLDIATGTGVSDLYVPDASTTQKGVLKIGSAATDAAAGDHTHPLSIAADTGTSEITLAHDGKYKITAGGSTFIFTMPSGSSTDHNQTIKVGTVTFDSDATINFVGSGGTSITGDATNNTITITSETTSADTWRAIYVNDVQKLDTSPGGAITYLNFADGDYTAIDYTTGSGSTPAKLIVDVNTTTLAAYLANAYLVASSGKLSVDASTAGNAAASKIVARSAAGAIQTEKLAVSSGTTTKATMQYNTTDECIEFVFA